MGKGKFDDARETETRDKSVGGCGNRGRGLSDRDLQRGIQTRRVIRRRYEEYLADDDDDDDDMAAGRCDGLHHIPRGRSRLAELGVNLLDRNFMISRRQPQGLGTQILETLLATISPHNTTDNRSVTIGTLAGQVKSPKYSYLAAEFEIKVS